MALDFTVEVLPMGDVVLDPALQMRAAGVQEDVAQEYAEGMANGQHFPIVRVVRVDGEALLVDGWHRFRAHQILERAMIQAEVADGSRVDAIKEAAGANTHHGLRRTPEDKRRAARALLQDPELCSWSNREAAKHIGVSRQHIQNMRNRYSVSKGERLTRSRIELVDGEPPAEWQELHDRAGFYREAVEKVRRSLTLEDIAKAQGHHRGEHTCVPQAVALRLRELADDVWPWAEFDPDASARAKRCGWLDTVEDLEDAIAARTCPDPVRLFRVWRAARRVDELSQFEAEGIRASGLFRGRAQLEAALEAREGQLRKEEAERPPSPVTVAAEIARMPPEDQAEAVLTCSDELLDRFLRVSHLTPEGTAAARDRYDARAEQQAAQSGAEEKPTIDCPDPLCNGFHVWVSSVERYACRVCNLYEQQAAQAVENRRADFEKMLKAGSSQQVLGVTLNREALALLAEIAEYHADDISDADVAPEEKRSYLATIGKGRRPEPGQATHQVAS